MGWALPPRRCTGLSMLGLEVFRSLTCGRCSEKRRPAPSLSSGATPEYDRSRQSHDSSVRRSRRRDLSALRHADDPPLPASSHDHHRQAADGHPGHEDRASTQRLFTPPGATSEETAPAAGERRRSRREPEGARRTALSCLPRPKPWDIAAERPRTGTASHPRPDEGTRGVEFVDSHTRVHGGSSFHAFSEPPTRLSGESQSSRHSRVTRYR